MLSCRASAHVERLIYFDSPATAFLGRHGTRGHHDRYYHHPPDQPEKIYAGKVRDLYEIDDKRMLMIATDRLSAFDVIFDELIPKKAKS